MMLAAHFSDHELGADTPGIPPDALSNLYLVATWLEAARAALGDNPIDVTSGYRTPSHNAAVGGSSTSDHPNGLAADFYPGVTLYGAYDVFRTPGTVPPWDQLIYYPVDGHIHVGLGPRMRGEHRLALAEGGYPLMTPALIATRWWIPLVVLAVALFLFPGRKGSA